MGLLNSLKIWIGAVCFIFFVSPVPSQAQYYNLSVGVERLYDGCHPFPFYPSCPLGFSVHTIESVRGEKEIDGQRYAEIAVDRVVNGTNIRVAEDTLCYRMNGSRLLQWTPAGDRLLYDFSFIVGDSLKHHQFFGIDSGGSDYYKSQLQDIKILVDTLVEMGDGTSYRVLYREDQQDAIATESFYDEYLTVHSWFTNWQVPFKRMLDGELPYEELPHHFYYVEGFGVLYTPMAGRNNLIMVGFKNVDGALYGSFPPYLVSIEREEHPSGIALDQNYPNPFNPSTVIEFELPVANHVHLAVYDQLGREIEVLVNEILPSGRHQTSFDGQNLSSGIYVYRLQSGEHLLTGKMVLMK